MKTKISSIGYVNKIRDNILSIRRKTLAPLYEELKAADCVVCGGSGRSLYSINAAMSQIALSQVGWRNKVVLTPDDPGFPGKNMYDAAADLEKRYKKTLLLMNSKTPMPSRGRSGGLIFIPTSSTTIRSSFLTSLMALQ